MSLYFAAKHRREATVRLLLDLSAEADARNNDGLDLELPGGYYSSPLQTATLGGHRDVVKRLLAAGASALSKDSHG